VAPTEHALTGTDVIVQALEALAAELPGWRTWLRLNPGEPAALSVGNPEPGAGALAELIMCEVAAGERWYCWPWGDRIGTDPTRTAATIRQVLRSADAR
jgi:hypothetical protein